MCPGLKFRKEFTCTDNLPLQWTFKYRICHFARSNWGHDTLDVQCSQQLSLLNENSAERRKLQDLDRLEANEDESTWFEQCSKKFINILS